MRVKLLVFFLLLLVLFPNSIRAGCDNTRLSELSSIAGNVGFSTTYRVENNYPIFTVEVSNITDDVYVADQSGTLFTNYSNTKDYYSSVSPMYTVYSNDPTCYGEKLVSRSINIPVFNKYSYYKECKDFPNEKICQLWGNYVFETDEFFYKTIENLKASKNSSDTAETTNEFSASDSFKYILIFAVSFVTAIIALIILFVRRKRSGK